jgi:hypothetical protein
LAKNNIMRINLVLDSALLLLFLFVHEQKAIGLFLHEWCGLLLLIVVIIHILLHWNWIDGVFRKFFRKMKVETRINQIIVILIYIGITVVMFSGIMISREAIPAIGIHTAKNIFWKWLHFKSVDVTIWLVAAHVGMHWRWILNNIKGVLTDRLFRKSGNKISKDNLPV